MMSFIKEEKKHVFLYSILVLVLGYLILSTFELPLLAGVASCGSEDCDCSCYGTGCWCWAEFNSCECSCNPLSYELCMNGDKKVINPFPRPED